MAKKREALFATLAVVLIGSFGVTTVYLIGSGQRRADRAEYLGYEEDVLVPLRESGRIAQQEMTPSLDQLRSGALKETEAVARADGWRRALAAARSEIAALTPPAFLDTAETRLRAAIDAYAQVPDLFDQAARASGAVRAGLLDAAADRGRRAGDLIDDAARIMQFHRRRLGLGATSELPDPAATERP